jgi:hypothetical protein
VLDKNPRITIHGKKKPIRDAAADITNRKFASERLSSDIFFPFD